MAFYNIKKLENDFDYIVDSYAAIRDRELYYIENSELYSEDIECLNILKNHDFNWLIESMQDFFPKTFNQLKNRQLKYQVAFRESFAESSEIVFYPFFLINERIYWITLPAYAVGNIRESISHGMCRNLGGVICTDSSTPIWGQTLISEPTSWQSFDDYLGKKIRKKLFKAL
ncbi:hypothetical protein [Acinetobacter sp. MD2(2019)]|uniref:hypothetical protein n=1 Tax=Acinetobacter sp. MD2(2019) TaxID=2605273 RepID=UPI002D1E7ACC|nr:hypothetical protein [Acinetobacter sp. MD2(2019)]MEB3752790.1 hypothetical protein [Acinetobacter sp. MD2(2019)]